MSLGAGRIGVVHSFGQPARRSSLGGVAAVLAAPAATTTRSIWSIWSIWQQAKQKPSSACRGWIPAGWVAESPPWCPASLGEPSSEAAAARRPAASESKLQEDVHLLQRHRMIRRRAQRERESERIIGDPADARPWTRSCGARSEPHAGDLLAVRHPARSLLSGRKVARCLRHSRCAGCSPGQQPQHESEPPC